MMRWQAQQRWGVGRESWSVATTVLWMSVWVLMVGCAGGAATQEAPVPAEEEPTAAQVATENRGPDSEDTLTDADLEAAIQPYDEGRYEEAIAALRAIAVDEAKPVPVRREALQYLGRAHLAQNEMERVREALHALLDLEPPLVELNPDVEPPPLMRLYYEVRRDFQGSYEVERGPSGLQTLAIMDFTNSSVDEFERFAPLQQGLSSMMINHLSGATGLRVIERERLQWLLDELELQQDADRVDQATAVQSGRLLGAQTVLFGSFTVHEGEMWMSGRVVEVETGAILLAEQVRGARDSFYDLVETLSLKVATAIDARLDAATLGERRETRSLQAMIAYSEGLALLEREAYADAYEKFQQALAYDPAYTRAAVRAASLQPLLS